jgi:DNA polymerase-1
VVSNVRAVNEGGTVFSDGVNLSSAKSRSQFIVELRHRLNGTCCPTDDDLEMQLLRLLEQAEEVLAYDPAPQAAAAPAGDEERVEDYIRTAHGFDVVRVREVGGEVRETRMRLSNFTAEVTEDISWDDGGGEPRRYFAITGQLGGRPLPVVRIDAAHFPPLSWVTDSWGVDARVMPGTGKRDLLRDAIQAFSRDAVRRTVRGHTGWLRLPDKTLLFLHARGAIGKDGVVTGIEVEVEGKLRGYCLPTPPNGAELQAAVRWSWTAWEVAVPTVAAPVLGVMYAAPLAEWLRPDFSLWMRGRSGLLKSSYVTAALNHYGPWDWKHAPAGWESTVNFLEKASFWVKDLPFLVDDYRPPADRNEAGEMRRKAARLIRAAGNLSGRGRLQSDTRSRPEYYPRGIVLVTAEEQAPGESGAARVWDVPIGPGDIDAARLRELQVDGEALGRAAAGYIRYLAGRLEPGSGWLTTLFNEALARARTDGGHLRHPQTFAHLFTGWLVFAEFAVAVGAVDRDAAVVRLNQVAAALDAVARLQDANAQRVRPDVIFIETLGALLAGQKAHLAAVDGTAPADAPVWGWVVHENERDPSLSYAKPLGDKLGWIDDGFLYLIPSLAHRLVTKTVSERGESFLVSAHALNEALQRGGFLAPGTKGLRHNQWAEGRQQDVIRLDLRAVLGCDIETAPLDAGLSTEERKRQALDPRTGRLRLVQLAAEDVDPDTGAPVTVAFIIDASACPEWATVLGPVLTNPDTRVVFHNAKFDLTWLLAAGVTVGRVADTMLMSQVLDAGEHLGGLHRGFFTLAAVAERELGEHLNKDEQLSDWSAPVLSDAQLRYAAMDAAVLLPLYHRLTERLADAGLTETAVLECAAVPAVAWLEWVGAPFQVEPWLARSDAEMARTIALESEIVALLTEALGANTLFGRQVNLDSPVQVKDALAQLGIVVTSTDEEALAAVADRHPVVPKLLAYREAAKLATTYGVEYVTNVHPVTARIHASYRHIGAATGRMSCTAPNLQQVPRDPVYRACFRPEPGRVLVKADLSLIELCVAAELSGDTRMIGAITDGQDLHRLTAAALFGKDPGDVTKDERAFGKTVNFGTLFGQGRRGLMAQAAQHGISLDEAGATRFQQRFAQAWPQLDAWRTRQMRGTATEIRTASGRARRLGRATPGTVRANTPIQGTAADGFKAALARLWQTRARCPSAVPVLAVHDELVVECDVAEAEVVAVWVAECLTEGMGQYVQRVPVRVDVTVAADWSGGRTQ